MTAKNLIARDRAPDYHIGANGIPRLTQVITAGSRMRKMNSHHQQHHLQQQLQPTDPVKLNKCLYNLTVRNSSSSTVQSDKPANSSKIESDIAIRNTQYSSVGGSKSSSSLSPASLNSCLRRSSPSTTTVTSSPLRTSGDPRRSGTNTSHQFNSSSSIPRSNNNNSSSYSSRNNSGGGSPRTLLGSRQRYQQQHRSAVTTGDDDGVAAADGTDANLINAGGDRRSSAVVRQYNRLSAAIDNRLSYQRKYDRTIFGCNRLDQFVLPPLQI